MQNVDASFLRAGHSIFFFTEGTTLMNTQHSAAYQIPGLADLSTVEIKAVTGGSLASGVAGSLASGVAGAAAGRIGGIALGAAWGGPVGFAIGVAVGIGWTLATSVSRGGRRHYTPPSTHQASLL